MTRQTLQYGDQRIPYTVQYTTRRGHKLAIHVLPTGRVQVDAPHGVALVDIKRAVARRASWLSSHLGDIGARRMAVLPREYVSGESHLYLGRRYLLKVRESRIEEPSVSLRRGRFEVITGGNDPSLARELLGEWYKARARAVFQDQLEEVVADLSWLDRAPRWKLVAMRHQWGSCSPSDTLSLNLHLIKAPRSCIGYVLLHELCHLRFHNHSPAFHRLLARHMPTWKLTKRRLDDMADELLAT